MIQSNYLDFSKRFEQHLSKLSYEEGFKLGLNIFKRMFFDYKAFVNETGWGNPDVLLDAFTYIESGGKDTKVIEQYQSEVEQVTLDPDDFVDGSCALNACTAIFNLLAFVRAPKDKSLLYEVGISYYDTIDFKVQEENERNEEVIANHPLFIEAKRFLLNEEVRFL